MISLVRARAVAKKRNHHYHRIIWLFIVDVFSTAHPLMVEGKNDDRTPHIYAVYFCILNGI